MSQVDSVMKIFRSIEEQPRAAEQNSLFVDFLVKETNLEKTTIQEYIDLYRSYRACDERKTAKGYLLWSGEEKKLFKKFFDQFCSKMDAKPICEQFSEINGRTAVANKQELYKHFSFYDPKKIRQKRKKRTKKTTNVTELHSFRAKKEAVSLLPREQLNTHAVGFVSEESLPNTYQEEESIVMEVKTPERTEKENDTLLSDLQMFLQNAGQLQSFDISGLFKGLATLSILAVQNEKEKDTMHALHEKLNKMVQGEQEQAKKITAVEKKIQQIHHNVSLFDQYNSLEKLTNLTDFMEELKKISKSH